MRTEQCLTMHGGGIGTLRQRVSWQEAEEHRLWIWSGPVKPPAVEFTGHLLWARSQARPWRVLNLAAGRAGLGSLQKAASLTSQAQVLGTWGREGTLSVREPWRLCPAKPENRGLRGGQDGHSLEGRGAAQGPRPPPAVGADPRPPPSPDSATVVSPQHPPQGWASS